MTVGSEGAAGDEEVRAAASLLDSTDLARLVRAGYGFGDAMTLAVLTFAVNTSYLIADRDRRFVLRVKPTGHRSQPALEAELGFLDQLAERGVRVPTAISAISGDRVMRFRAPDGPRLASVFQFVPGRVAAETVEDAHLVGAAAANLHNKAEKVATLPQRIRYDAEQLLDRPLETISAYFGHRPNDLAYLTQLGDRVGAFLRSDVRDDLRSGPIHGDLQQKNALIDDESRVSLIDFDECGTGWYADDLASWLMAAQWQHVAPELQASFVAGYQAVRPLTDAELYALDWLIVARSLYWMSWQLDSTRGWGPVTWLGDDWFSSHLTLVRAQANNVRE